jgi:Acyl-ACP thioesterase
VPWRFRAADLDLADHVNNAVYWEALEEGLAADHWPEPLDDRRAADRSPEPLDAEIEHRAPGDAGKASLLLDGRMLWVTAPNGEVLASFLCHEHNFRHVR